MGVDPEILEEERETVVEVADYAHFHPSVSFLLVHCFQYLVSSWFEGLGLFAVLQEKLAHKVSTMEAFQKHCRLLDILAHKVGQRRV